MEQKILFLINRQWTSPALDLFMAGITNFAVWTGPLILLGLVLLIFGGFKARAFVVCAAMIVGFCDGVVSNGLKALVKRPRPHEVLADVRMVQLAKATPRFLALWKKPRVKTSRDEPGEEPGARSFPSAHTMNTFCGAMLAALFFRRRGAWWLLVAAAVGYSRIYTGSHWPGDVLGSAFLGVAVALLGFCALEILWRRLAFKNAHPSLLGAR